MTEAAGIYVHLPYCRSRCGYCAFVVSTDDSSRSEYLEALAREAATLSEEAAGRDFDSIYLGGGTPSLVPPADLRRLLDDLRRNFAVDEAHSEVTLEANPEDLTGKLVGEWRDAGVNRVSVGVQSFHDSELSAVGRRHDANGARRALAILSQADVSISADLILGLPTQTSETFRQSVDEVGGAGVGHLSIYLLETEKSRTIEEDRRNHPDRYLSDEAQAEAWLEAGETLASRGFSHYEISNWARPGRQASHNLKYWTRTPTLGLGVSAHELWDGRRRANVSGLPAYLAALRDSRRPTALDEPVAPDAVLRERIFLGLRLSTGVPAAEIEGWIGDAGDSLLAEDYAAWLEAGLLARENGRVGFTERGFLVSNEVLCRFV